MRIATRTTHEVTLEGDEIFDIQAPAAYSGNTVTARISRIKVTRDADESLSWRLYGYKVKRDGAESLVSFEYWPDRETAFGVWMQVPGEVRAQLPHSLDFARRYLRS